ncbi:MAG: LamG-like jellyroll fold domain-containing protein [Candidatus Micrarchaeia archaeon]
MNKGQFAVTAWIYVDGQTGTEQMPVSIGADVCYKNYSIGPNDTGVILIAAPGYPASAPSGAQSASSNPQPDYFKAAACIFNTTYNGARWGWTTASFNQSDYNKWIFVATTYNGTYLDLYINGKLVNSTLAPGKILVPEGYLSLGNMYSPIYSESRFWYNGSLSNVQIYNQSISAQGIEYLYKGGIGEPPEELDKLALWIPLNGNAGDYSGNTYGNKFYNGSYYGWIDNYRYT